MKIVQAQRTESTRWDYLTGKQQLKNPLVFVFANRFLLEDKSIIESIRQEFPYQDLVFGSTSGEIIGQNVTENSVSVTAVEFEKSSFIVKRANILAHDKNAHALGIELINEIPKENLKHVFVISEGSFVNGSSLIDGIESGIDDTIALTGGMCGDDARFEKTLASYQEDPKEGEVDSFWP